MGKHETCLFGTWRFLYDLGCPCAPIFRSKSKLLACVGTLRLDGSLKLLLQWGHLTGGMRRANTRPVMVHRTARKLGEAGGPGRRTVIFFLRPVRRCSAGRRDHRLTQAVHVSNACRYCSIRPAGTRPKTRASRQHHSAFMRPRTRGFPSWPTAVWEGRIRLYRLLRPPDRNHFQTGRAIRLAVRWRCRAQRATSPARPDPEAVPAVRDAGSPRPRPLARHRADANWSCRCSPALRGVRASTPCRCAAPG